MMKLFKPNIYFSPDQIKNFFNDSINFTLENIQCYCNDPVSDFTRDRLLPARTLIDCILSFSNYSTTCEMSHFFSDCADMPSPSALSQRRKLLDPDIFKRINNLFLRCFDNYKTINGYYIFAQDCSDINIPFMDDDTKVHYEDGRKPSCQYHINALYDCLNHIFYDWSIDAASKKREPDALISIINHKNYPHNSIFTADRGYENYNLLAHLCKNNLKFAIRVKDIESKNGIMTNIKTENETFDMK